MKLGRLPHARDRLAAAPPHRRGAAGPLPAAYAGPALPWVPTLAQNLTLPTCTVAGLANSFRLWGLRHGFDLLIDEQCLLDLYAALAGCAPTPEAIAGTDGLVMLDLLEHIREHGFHFGGQSPAELTFAAIPIDDLAGLRDAIWVHGSVYVGVDLFAGDVTAPPRWIGTPSGGEEGGHCIVPYRWDAAGFGDATWGETVDDDLAWMSSRIREAYAVQWLWAVA